MNKPVTHNDDTFMNGDDSGIAISGDNNEIKENNRPIKNKDPYRYSASSNSTATTITIHYYPEGGWGWIIVIVTVLLNLLTQGFHLSSGVLLNEINEHFKKKSIVDTGWLISTSIGVSLFISPITVAICIKKSTRLMTVIGGLVASLGCLFTSFATEFHQLFFSYGLLFGIGVSMIRDSSVIMIGQYYKKRRKLIEIFIVSSTGLGLSIMSPLISYSITLLNYRLGLHLVSGVLFSAFFLGMFFRSASLYHPQRRAILHLKYQKKKIKEKNPKKKVKTISTDSKILRSKTFQIIFISNCLSCLGLYNPIIFIAYKSEVEGIEQYKIILIQIYMGLAWIIGSVVVGVLFIQKRLKLIHRFCQISIFICCFCISAEGFLLPESTGFIGFVCVYGFLVGGYNYSLKMLIYENSYKKNFNQTWSYLQFSQSISMFLGIPICSYAIENDKMLIGYMFSSSCLLFGAATMFLLKCNKRKKQKEKNNCYCSTSSCNCQHGNKSPQLETNDNKQEEIIEFNLITQTYVNSTNDLCNHELEENNIDVKPELTCISEEGIADMDLSDSKLINQLQICK